MHHAHHHHDRRRDASGDGGKTWNDTHTATLEDYQTPVDVILFLVQGAGISHPRLDGLYNRNQWVFVLDNHGLMSLVSDMSTQGLIKQENGAYVKGPKWYSPAFVLENKCVFE
ncbi:hypothetical protein P0Y43_02755 [Pseudomonas entomophila]|uniref:hypothetical protein n=1 Tax=Pseudomonas entomophila TaxID=312306 RepID=UPI0023D8A7A7|nr:hypothetical protein [Pseudomonas entomophila]MDF0729648.1 hypothetical protein [Pseudomonas entomophila]